MGTGWRRVFCTSTLHRNSEVDAMTDEHILTSSPTSLRSCTGFGFFSNPSTPRLHCRTSAQSLDSNPSVDTPTLRCKTATSPRSPLKLSLFRNSFWSRSNCGVCERSVKTGQGMAIYTAECGHGFHFQCICSHFMKEGKLICPVCNVLWKDAPLLNVNTTSDDQQDKSMVAITKISSTPRTEKLRNNTSKQEYHHCQLKHVAVIRTYDDDESLLTPTAAGGKFNPIPESDEEENEQREDEEEVEEFQGFFVNPIPSCSPKPSLKISSTTVDVKLMPEAAILSVNQTHETYAVSLRVKAPSTPQQSEHSRRAPVDLVAVLDLSGCMVGSKLHMLKRAMCLVISSLGASDRLSIVAFSAVTKRLMPLRRMTSQGKLSANHIVDRLICGQGSNPENALKKATKVLEDRREKNPVASVLLLSDAQDEQPGRIDIHRRERNRVPSAQFAYIEIPVHAFACGKVSHYSHDAAEDEFTKRLGDLLSVLVQDLRLKIKLDVNGADITAVYCNHFRPTFLGSDSIRLGELYPEEERDLLVEIKLPASVVAGRMAILTARCSYRDAATQETINCKEHTLLLPKLRPVRSTAPKIERLRNLFIATRAIAEARGLINERDFANAQCLLMSARALVLQSSSSDAAAGKCVRGLEVEMVELARRKQLEKRTTAIEQRRRRKQEEWDLGLVDENGDPLTPTSAWRAAELLAKVAMMKKKSLTKVSDLHGFENARF